VKGVALLIVNHPDRASDQWIWRPAIGRDSESRSRIAQPASSAPTFSSKILEERDVDQ